MEFGSTTINRPTGMYLLSSF